jgi:hypothetical protein
VRHVTGDGSTRKKQITTLARHGGLRVRAPLLCHQMVWERDYPLRLIYRAGIAWSSKAVCVSMIKEDTELKQPKGTVINGVVETEGPGGGAPKFG